MSWNWDKRTKKCSTCKYCLDKAYEIPNSKFVSRCQLVVNEIISQTPHECLGTFEDYSNGFNNYLYRYWTPLIKRCHTCLFNYYTGKNCILFPNDEDYDQAVEECLGGFDDRKMEYMGYRLWKPKPNFNFHITKKEMEL